MRGRLLSLPLAAAALVGCARLTTPTDDRVVPMPEAVAEAPASAAPAPAAPAPAPVAAKPPEERVKASHILVAYKGAMRAAPEITRSKADAKKLAEELQVKLAKAKPDAFADAAKKSSDDKGSGKAGGDLGEFTRTQMVKPFADAAFALRPGEVSKVVESDFGFHVIRRAP
ncbi:MAG: peptidyl-prolyl cis-trans isomerase [Polyangiaceae bacterium]|nr:peptidyl-prolyl cis-trans isomerase [Polyangiaceae bacterium]